MTLAQKILIVIAAIAAVYGLIVWYVERYSPEVDADEVCPKCGVELDSMYYCRNCRFMEK